MKTLVAIIITFVATVVVLVIIGFAMKSKGQPNPKDTKVVRIESPQRGDLIEFINAPGVVEPKRKVAISAKVSARIAELPYEQGERVTKGDPNATPPIPASVLVRLDASDLEAALLSAEAHRAAQAAQIEVAKMEIEANRASVEGTRILLKQAQRELQRLIELISSQDISQSELDDAQCRVDELKMTVVGAEHGLKATELSLVVSRHRLTAADADIARARDNLGHTTIASPMDGVVTRINAEVGEMVMTGTMNNPGTVIIQVADLSQMILVAQVDEADIPRVQPSQPAKVHVQAWPDKIFQGVVDSVALTRDSARDGSMYYRTEILLTDDEHKIISGLSADVDIQICQHKGILRVPSQAILGRKIDELPVEIREDCPQVDKKKAFASVVYRHLDGEAVVTPVKIGQSDATHTIVLAGLTQDDKIVTGPYKVLEAIKHKQKVTDEREAKKDKQSAQETPDSNTPDPND